MKILSESHKKHLSESHMGHEGHGKGKKRESMTDEKHPRWKGDEASYGCKHNWIYRKFGKANKCKQCNTLESKRFVWHNLSSEYKREKDDWVQLCSKCHANLHKNWEKRWVCV